MGRFEELNTQISIIKWARCASSTRPELLLLHSIPNGQNTTEKNRINLVRSGLKAGIPDLFLPVPRGTFHGLYIEVKSKNGVLSKQQKECISMLKEQGYDCFVTKNAWDCISYIENYLNT